MLQLRLLTSWRREGGEIKCSRAISSSWSTCRSGYVCERVRTQPSLTDCVCKREPTSSSTTPTRDQANILQPRRRSRRPITCTTSVWATPARFPTPTTTTPAIIVDSLVGILAEATLVVTLVGAILEAAEATRQCQFADKCERVTNAEPVFNAAFHQDYWQRVKCNIILYNYTFMNKLYRFG